MTNEEMVQCFDDIRAFIQGNPNLRDPEVDGWFRMPSSVTGPLVIWHVEKNKSTP